MKPAAHAAKALIVIVHYRAQASLAALLESLVILKRFSEVDVVVADNNSSQERLSEMPNAPEEMTKVHLLELPDNRGYFGGARVALEDYLSQGHPAPDWVIACNHDLLFEDENFLTVLLSLDPSAVGVLAPSVRTRHGLADQNPFMRRRPSRLRWAWLRLVSSSYGLAVAWDWLARHKGVFVFVRQKLRTRKSGGRQAIYAAHGSCLILSRRFFEAGGTLDSNLFLYGEEVAIAESCRLLGLPIVYEPALRIVHNEHTSMGHKISRFSYQCQKRALQYLHRRYWLNSPEPIALPQLPASTPDA